MKTLLETYRSREYKTDKNTAHCYIEKLYNDLFQDKEYKKVLEIGVFDGGSILLWRDYFEQAQIDAVDIRASSIFKDEERINHIIGNAYTKDFVKNLSNDYDLVIDDGPHTLDSMKFFVNNYINLLNDDGIAIIEDVQNMNWVPQLCELVPDNFTHKVYDLRNVKNRWDDIVITIQRLRDVNE